MGTFLDAFDRLVIRTSKASNDYLIGYGMLAIAAAIYAGTVEIARAIVSRGK